MSDLSEFQVSDKDFGLITGERKKTKINASGTSIGFKNIASKIAYDLRLWLDSKRTAQQPFPAQQSKSLDYDHQPEPGRSNTSAAAPVRSSASVGLTASVLAEQNEEDEEIYGEAADDSGDHETTKATDPPVITTPTTTATNTNTQCSKIATIVELSSNSSPLPIELNADTTNHQTSNETDKAENGSSNVAAASDVDANKPDNNTNIQLGYNNMIASLLRTTTL